MCGIAGRVNQTAPVDRAEIFRMTELIAHRGPDDHGYHLRTQVGLGHRRLSIIDLAGGRQPLANEDDSVWIVFNGEIYNHVELRRELVARGHKFRTHSDTEAIVHAYEEWGVDCAKRLRGMFGFAIWDDRKKKLVLVRDRMGIKPIYYAQLGGDLVFGSEIKSLLAVPQIDGAIDDDALAAYLALRYVPAPLTMFRGIKKLPPATVLTWQRGKAILSRYWDLADVETRDATPPTEAEAANELQTRIDHATKLRLMAEVPVGAFLSGGLDSTYITAAMLRAADARGALKTFSVGYAEDAAQSEDELAYARLAAGALGTEHHERRVTMKEAADALPKIVWHLDEPVADAACVPLYFLSQAAKQHVTVVLSGEGADEAMGGYSIYRKWQRMEQLRARLGAGSSALSLLGRLGAKLPSDKLRRAARLCAGTLETSYRGVSRAFDDDVVERLHKTHSHGANASDVLHSLLAPHWEATRGMTPLRRMLYLDGKVWLPDDLLVKADKMTMAHAIELRVPFLDHELMEHTWSLPDHMKIAGGVGKALLRKAARGRVPQAVLDRPKMGFGTPTAAWLRGGMRDMADAALFDPRSLAHERFDTPFLHQLWDRHQAGADLSAELWPLVVLELWHRNFNAEARPRPEPLSEVA
ncbi:MAG TPA: asparagine synthase (glutamine-hydrolyzing) [Polyangia bacterium]|nr:asparagine synthase (glutamine-hydrolyzing) [Polyangia bacterium]